MPRVPYLHLVGNDADMQQFGVTFLYWFLPGLALQFAAVSMSSALRGTGLVKPTMTVQLLSILLNVLLAPVLIAGWGTGSRSELQVRASPAPSLAYSACRC